MRSPYIFLLFGFFLAFLEVLPAFSSFADAYYPESSSVVSKPSANIKQQSVLTRESKLETNQIAEESRVSAGSGNSPLSLSIFLFKTRNSSTFRRGQNLKTVGRLWLLNQKMIC